MAQIKGSLITARRSFVLAAYGETGWARILDCMPPEQRAAIDGMVLAINWYPLEIVSCLEETIVRELGHGDAALYEEMGKHSAERNLKSLYSAFVAMDKDPVSFFSRLVCAYPQMHDYGQASISNPGPCGLDIVHDYAGNANAGFCRATVGFFKRAAEVFSVQEMTLRETACQVRGKPTCVIRLEWKQ